MFYFCERRRPIIRTRGLLTVCLFAATAPNAFILYELYLGLALKYTTGLAGISWDLEIYTAMNHRENTEHLVDALARCNTTSAYSLHFSLGGPVGEMQYHRPISLRERKDKTVLRCAAERVSTFL